MEVPPLSMAMLNNQRVDMDGTIIPPVRHLVPRPSCSVLPSEKGVMRIDKGSCSTKGAHAERDRLFDRSNQRR